MWLYIFLYVHYPFWFRCLQFANSYPLFTFLLDYLLTCRSSPYNTELILCAFHALTIMSPNLWLVFCLSCFFLNTDLNLIAIKFINIFFMVCAFILVLFKKSFPPISNSYSSLFSSKYFQVLHFAVKLLYTLNSFPCLV